jgi:hypothetical protein
MDLDDSLHSRRFDGPQSSHQGPKQCSSYMEWMETFEKGMVSLFE